MLAFSSFSELSSGFPSSIQNLKFRLVDLPGFHYASLHHVASVIVPSASSLTCCRSSPSQSRISCTAASIFTCHHLSVTSTPRSPMMRIMTKQFLASILFLLKTPSAQNFFCLLCHAINLNPLQTALLVDNDDQIELACGHRR